MEVRLRKERYYSRKRETNTVATVEHNPLQAEDCPS